MEISRCRNRCAVPDNEPITESFTVADKGRYCLLASDGSQISSSHHDALPISLVNISTVFYQPQSGRALRIDRYTDFIRKADNSIRMDIVPENFVNSIRDVKELQVLANWAIENKFPLVTLSDGPLELFHEPRSDKSHKDLFNQYLEILYKIHRDGKIMGGYTDKPRARLVLRMLERIYSQEPSIDLEGITDADVFAVMLPPRQRSAIFQINSPSSSHYVGPLALRFFYLNVGREKKPWIVRIEITVSTENDPTKTQLLHQALLDQCDLMGSRPYPYVLHRAHEEAVIHFDEKEKITTMLSYTLMQSGVEIGSRSFKSSAKELEKRTRMK
ncbi:MAG: DNA double-strand break repair nuclease NurA [Anaerolineaceae bacterium]|nr:DNA double-strand break repair nuclease NurA [Anaerolineaceae bacterium]